MAGFVDTLVGILVLLLSLVMVLGFIFLCWGIIWKVLLSRLGLFRELFNGLTGKNQTDEQTKERAEKRRAEMKLLKSSLTQRHRTKDGSCRSSKTVTFDSPSVKFEPSENLITEDHTFS